MDSETNIINEDAVNEEKPVEEGTLDKILSVFGDKGTNLTNMGEKLKEWEGTCNQFGTFFLHIGQVQFAERYGPVPDVIERATTVSLGVGGADVVRSVGAACTAASMFNDAPGLLALLDARKQEQPLKVILNSVEEAKGFISEWKIHKDAIEVDVCPALTLDEVGAIRRLFLTGDVVKVKLGQYEALQAARILPELPMSAVCSILAAVENGREKAPADVGQGQQKPSVP